MKIFSLVLFEDFKAAEDFKSALHQIATLSTIMNVDDIDNEILYSNVEVA